MIPKRYVAIVMIMSVLLLSACAQNPEQDIIANKNEGIFEEALSTENSGDLEREEIEYYEDSFEIKKDSLSVTVDADVKWIEGNIPVLKVTPHTFSVEEAQNYASILFGDHPVYDAKHILTKREIEERILELNSWINNPEELLERYGTEAYVEEEIAEFEKEIAWLEAQYPDAPDSDGVMEADWEFHPLPYYYDLEVDESSEETQTLNKTEALDVMSYLDGEEAMLSFTNRTESDYLLHMMSFFYESEVEMSENMQPVELTEEQAVELAQEKIAWLNLGEWDAAQILSLDSQGGSDYKIYFTPVYEGIPSLLPEGQVDLQSDDMYAAHLYFSALRMRLCNGELLSFTLYSPMDVIEVENENIEVLSFDKIYEAFKSYAESGLQSEIEKRNLQKTDAVTITRIEQKLFRAKVKGSDTEFRMIPVWVFYGTAERVSETKEMEIAVFNAVDGSIIDPYLGY